MASIGNIPLDTSDILAIPPSLVVYGEPGTGKSTEMARAFPGVMYVQSSPTILHAYADYAKKHPELGWQVPIRVTFDDVVKSLGGSPTGALVSIIDTYIKSCDLPQPPFKGIVFDEWNTILERVFAELKTDPWGKFKGRGGGLNIFAVFDYFKSIHRSALSISRRTRRMVGFVAHHQTPKWDEDENSQTRGQLKWAGGPKMPMGLSDQMAELCAEADIVVQLVVRAPGAALSLDGKPPPTEVQRVFLTQADPKWFRKVRGFGVAAEEVLDLAKQQGLRELVERAGYVP